MIDCQRCNAFRHDGCTLTPPTVNDGAGPAGIAVDAKTHTVDVADVGSGPTGDVSVFDAATSNATTTSGCKNVQTLQMPGGNVLGVTVDAATDTVYVTTAPASGPSTVGRRHRPDHRNDLQLQRRQHRFCRSYDSSMPATPPRSPSFPAADSEAVRPNGSPATPCSSRSSTDGQQACGDLQRLVADQEEGRLDGRAAFTGALGAQLNRGARQGTNRSCRYGALWAWRAPGNDRSRKALPPRPGSAFDPPTAAALKSEARGYTDRLRRLRIFTPPTRRPRTAANRHHRTSGDDTKRHVLLSVNRPPARASHPSRAWLARTSATSRIGQVG
jgi:hypothetical protein